MVSIDFTNVFSESENMERKNSLQRILKFSEDYVEDSKGFPGFSWEDFEGYADNKKVAAKERKISGEELPQLFFDYCKNFFYENRGKGYIWFIERLKWVEIIFIRIDGPEYSETVINYLTRLYFSESEVI